MVSDETPFFTDPDEEPGLHGVGSPGPLVGGDQVRLHVKHHVLGLGIYLVQHRCPRGQICE